MVCAITSRLRSAASATYAVDASAMPPTTPPPAPTRCSCRRRTGFALSHEESLRYFATVAAAVAPVPVVAYNVPSRVGVNLEPALIAELATSGVIAGVKDSSGNLEAHRLIAGFTAGVEAFRRYTGSELCIDGALLAGFVGAVPGLANVFVDHHVALLAAAASGDWPAAAAEQATIVAAARLYDVPRGSTSFSGAAIGALKEALVQLGVITTARTADPFLALGDDARRHVEAVLEAVGQRVAVGARP